MQSSSGYSEYQERVERQTAARRQEMCKRAWFNAGCPRLQSERVLAPDVDTPEWTRAFKWAMQAVDRGGIIALVGDRGTGKTQIAVELVRRHTLGFLTDSTPRKARYSRTQEVFAAIRECYGPKPARREAEVVAEFTDPWLMILDEAHDRAHSEFETRTLNLILDKRYGDMRPTVIIANADAEGFRQQIGESIFDRIAETGGILPCVWPSFRAKGAA
jgi:DNA replication protein DnaC